jgi:hypothetical protein
MKKTYVVLVVLMLSFLVGCTSMITGAVENAAERRQVDRLGDRLPTLVFEDTRRAHEELARWVERNPGVVVREYVVGEANFESPAAAGSFLQIQEGLVSDNSLQPVPGSFVGDGNTAFIVTNESILFAGLDRSPESTAFVTKMDFVTVEEFLFDDIANIRVGNYGVTTLKLDDQVFFVDLADSPGGNGFGIIITGFQPRSGNIDRLKELLPEVEIISMWDE